MSRLTQYETRDGPMLGFAADAYVSRSLELYGEYSPGERLLFQQLLKPGNTVVEVGANIGALTVPIARACAPGPVYAFEPQQRVFQALCANLALNGVENVLAYPSAVGDAAGTVASPDIDYDTVDNPGAIPMYAASDKGVPTQMVAIDDLDLPACHLIKADVEGMETAVLLGAARTIERLRPILYIENDRAEHQQAVLDLIHRHRYRMYWHTPRLFEPDNFRGNPDNVFPGLVSLNVLALPAERPTNIPNKPIDPQNWRSPTRLAGA